MARRQQPLYQQVIDDLRQRIASGHYALNEKIPSEPELSQEFGVSRITLRRAIEELCADGYLIKQQGRGTFVSTPHINRHLLQNRETQSFSDVCTLSGLKPGARLIKREIVPSKPDEQEFLSLAEGALMLYIQRIRTANDQPIFEENIVLPYEDFKELLSVDLDDVSMFDAIEHISGRRPAKTLRKTVEALAASSEQSQRLAIAAHAPLLYLNVYFGDCAEKPLCIGRQFYVGSRYRFEF